MACVEDVARCPHRHQAVQLLKTMAGGSSRDAALSMRWRPRNVHNGPWNSGFLRECPHNAAVMDMGVQPLLRHTRPAYGSSVRQACWCSHSRLRVAREVTQLAKRGQGRHRGVRYTASGI